MSRSKGAHAPAPEMCHHLIESGHTEQSLALYVTRKATLFACPTCIADRIERRLVQPGGSPADAAASCHFNKCGHLDGASRACWPCLLATRAELTERWARLFHTDKHKANQLKRVLHHWNRWLDPHNQKPDSPEPAPARVWKSAVQMGEERNLQMARDRISKRGEAIRRERGFPEQSILMAQGQPTKTILVVPKGA